MVLQAAEFYDVGGALLPERAEAGTRRESAGRTTWPVFTRARGETDKAEAAYKQALALRPDDLATLVWLGRLHLDQGRPEAAEPLFARKRTASRHALSRRWPASAAWRSPSAITRRP